MKKIVILGASSNVGYQFSKDYSSIYELTLVSRSKIDDFDGDLHVLSLEMDSISALLDIVEPDYVVNCIAMGNVDECEISKVTAFDVNVHFVRSLVDVCNKLPACTLIHFSSNAIYSGKNPRYSETSLANPINYYGICKNQADIHVREKSNNYAILRPISIYGQRASFQRNNPINWLLDELIADKPLTLVDDVYTNMLFVEDVSNALHQVINNGSKGDFNLSSNARYSLYEIGIIAADMLGKNKSTIKRIDSKFFELNGMADRPKDTCFDNSKARLDLGVSFTEIGDGLSKLLDYKRG
jgi:dTDP-4-dehydrorhamnose reductase